MIGEDRERLTEATLQDLAEQIATAQTVTVASALMRHVFWLDADHVGYGGRVEADSASMIDQQRRPHDLPKFNVFVSGHGQPMLDRVAKWLASARPNIEWRWRLLSDYASATASRAAPAVAVAWLLTDELSGKVANPSSVGPST